MGTHQAFITFEWFSTLMHTTTHLAPWTGGCKIVPRKHNECVFSSASNHKMLFGTVWENHIKLRNKVNWHLKKETFFETFSYLFALWWLKEWDKSSPYLSKHQKAFKMSLCYYTENIAFFFKVKVFLYDSHYCSFDGQWRQNIKWIDLL